MSGNTNTSVALVEQHKKNVELRAWKSYDDDVIVNHMKLPDLMPKEDKEKDSTDVKLLLHLVDDILNRAIRNVNSTVREDEDYLKDETHRKDVIFMRERFNYKLDQIAYKIAYDVSSKADLHYTVLSIFKILRGHPWEARLILCLTAFALNYGDCWHLALKHSSHQLTESTKQVPDIHNQSHPALQEVNDLVRAILDIVKCIKDLHKARNQLEDADKYLGAADKISGEEISIPVTIYWSIKSVLVCASMITRFITMDLKYSVSRKEMTELEKLTTTLKDRKLKLQELKNSLDSKLDDKKAKKTTETIRSLLEFPEVDNMNVLRALLTHGRDPQPLHKGDEKADLEELRRKMVLLLISSIDIPREDIQIMEEIYNKSRGKPPKQQNQLEIVWLPMIGTKGNDHDDKLKDPFEKKGKMQWYTVSQPSLIANQVTQIAEKDWKFKGKPIIVVINTLGQVACTNAFPMIRIWGYEAYPFTISKEKDLWMDKSCNLELLFPFQNWITSEKQSKCLCGGENMEWIKMFTTRAPSVAKAAANAPLQMFYVGTPNPNKRIQRIIKTITTERLEDNDQIKRLEDNDQINFWNRLENLAHSRMQLGNAIYDDPVLQDIVLILNLGYSGDGWAVLCCGLDIKIIAKGEKILRSLVNFSQWKDNINESILSDQSFVFIHALEQHLIMNPNHIDEKKHVESCEKILDMLDNAVNGMEILKRFVSAKENWQPLIRGTTNQRDNVDVLENKELLLLLISDCNISREELASLTQMYTKSQNGGRKDESKYEIVWLPIEDPQQKFEDKLKQKFEDKLKQMPWYSVSELKMINTAAIRFIKQFWHYDGRTIVVALNKDGKVKCVQALRKITIWLQKVIESPCSTEETMWSSTSILYLIIVDLYPGVKEWIIRDDIICIYGGGNKEWPEKLVKIKNEVAETPLKMLYVGKSNLSHHGLSEFEKLDGEKLDKTLVQLFWYRIKSMWISKYEMGNKEDEKMKNLSQVLSFDSSGSGWAIVVKGEAAVVIAEDLFDSEPSYHEWQEQARKKGFIDVLKEKRKDKKIETPCLKFMLPEFAENKQEAAGCPHCNQTMRRFLTFKCCGHSNSIY